MKRFLVAVFAAFIGMTLVIEDAEARRLGGGRSAGMQRDSSLLRRDATPQQPAGPAQNAAAGARQQQSGASRWMGPLAGLAAGLGLAALASYLGLGEEFATLILMLLLAMGAVLVFRLLFRNRQPQKIGYATAGGPGGPQISRLEPYSGTPAAASLAPRAGNIPADFDVAGFVRQAKLNFVRLQAAHDAGNIEDIRNFTTPEMFAEIRLQMQERPSGPQQTDVVTLDAELLDLTQEGKHYIASVRFSGTIREEPDTVPQPFDEVWHLAKPVDGSGGWVIAGIQQSE